MRPFIDPDHEELEAVLADLIAGDINITAREVARRHPTLKNVSAFTRNSDRAARIEDAQARQNALRAIALGPDRVKVASVTEQLGKKTEEAHALKGQVEALVASHVACIRAVLRHGGMPALERFWADYKAVGEAVRAAGAVPARADVIPLAKR